VEIVVDPSRSSHDVVVVVFLVIMEKKGLGSNGLVQDQFFVQSSAQKLVDVRSRKR